MSLEADTFAALRGALAAIHGPQPLADELTSGLSEVCTDCYGVIDRVAAACQSNSLDALMEGAVAVILAAEGSAKALSSIMEQIGRFRSEAAQAAAAARAALAQAMADTGCPAVLTDSHRADPLDGSERVEITDPARLPLAMWKQPDPEPDKTAIRRALKAGPVPGAALVRSAPSVRIAIRQETQPR